MLAREVKLSPDVRQGDLVAFAATGAYTYSMASNYNRVGRPAVVAVRDGGSRVWLRREDDADLDRLEASAPNFRTAAPPGEGFDVRPARPEDARSFLEAVPKRRRRNGRYIRTEEVSQTARAVSATVPPSRHGGRRQPGGGVRWRRHRLHLHPARGAPGHPARRTLGMFVASPWRGRGVGTALMAERMRWAADAGVEQVDSARVPGQHGRHRAVPRVRLRRGGQAHPPATKSYGYEDEILMALWLGPPRRGGASGRRSGGVSDGVRVGLLGCGTVGTAVIRLLHDHARGDRAAGGMPPGGRARRRARPLEAARRAAPPLGVHRRTPRRWSTIPDIDIVCELMGGSEPAGSLILARVRPDKPVVTANKELLATRGRELFDASDAKGLDLYFEAAVGGGIPLVRPLKESLAAERLTSIIGIVNGTTNYVLTRMSEDGMSFAEALGGSPAPGLCGGRSHGRRGRARRRGEVRHPGLDRVQRAGRRRRRLPGGDRQGHDRRTSSSPGAWGTW